MASSVSLLGMEHMGDMRILLLWLVTAALYERWRFD